MHLHQGHAPATVWTLLLVLNTASNITIVAGYFTVPFTVLRRLIPWNSPCPAQTRFFRFVRIAGVLFFLTCGLHHAHAAMARDHLGWGIVSNQILQAFAIWCFILGFASIVNTAARRAAGGGGGACP